MVYRAIVKAEPSDGQTFGYFGLTGRRFKDRYYEHRTNFNDEACRKKKRTDDGASKKGTALLEKVWEIKDKGLTPVISWDIVDRAYPYKAGAKACDLCRAEKMHIALG